MFNVMIFVCVRKISSLIEFVYDLYHYYYMQSNGPMIKLNLDLLNNIKFLEFHLTNFELGLDVDTFLAHF